MTVTPQQEISKPLNSSKIPPKYLTFTFGERTFTFGGNERGFRSFGNFLFCCWVVLGLRGSGGARRGFQKYLNFNAYGRLALKWTESSIFSVLGTAPRTRQTQTAPHETSTKSPPSWHLPERSSWSVFSSVATARGALQSF